ncbi:Solute carrier family 27 (Fatty acid transporter) member 1/4 [Fasciolopsis buskii]|uniref:Very long-chain fatty acid transport protein n=1 Tax=Fasciolopsis buskii TaxID=27845 RepID=A0A8E0VH66_9TREM|nr:Solute carrier family 27 (Fatty acid transporter) member 1/4 [Fasciolopsis buski]
MARKEFWKPCYSFVLLLLIHYYLFRDGFLKSLFMSYIVYLSIGGWRFQRVMFLTAPRDLRGLRCLIMILYNTYWCLLTGETFGDMWNRTVRKRGRDRPAIYFEDQIWTYDQVDAYSNKVANHLLQAGFKRGDKIFLLLHSSPAYVAIWLGAAKAGVAAALLNYNLRQASLEHCLNAVDAKAIVVGTTLRDAFLEINGDKKFPSSMIWYADEKANTPESAHAMTTESKENWNQKLAEAPFSPPPPLARISNRREHLIYVYTSGTSGFPKAAIITKPRYILMSSGVRYSFRIYKSDVLYTPLPLYHTAAGICGVGQMLLHGTTLVIRSKFSASQFWTDCIKYKCTVVQYIGETCRYLVAQPPKPEDKQHQVRLAFGNGLRRETWIEFQKRFNVPRIGELYGATESTASIINSDFTVGAIGFIPQIIKGIYPIYLIKMDPNTEEPLRDPETGLCIECEEKEPGQLIGRISKRSPVRQYDGYVSEQASEKKVLRNVFKPGDAWFASGDLMYRDSLGYLYFSDRLGDTFRWRGENVSTAEVESVLLKAFPDMTATVYGIAVPKNEGKAGMAALVVDLSNMTEEHERELVDRLYQEFTSNLPTYARPLFLRLCKQIEMTSTFKLRKVAMVAAGFDPTNTKDHLYFLDATQKSYRRMDEAMYKKIVEGTIRF